MKTSAWRSIQFLLLITSLQAEANPVQFASDILKDRQSRASIVERSIRDIQKLNQTFFEEIKTCYQKSDAKKKFEIEAKSKKLNPYLSQTFSPSAVGGLSLHVRAAQEFWRTYEELRGLCDFHYGPGIFDQMISSGAAVFQQPGASLAAKALLKVAEYTPSLLSESYVQKTLDALPQTFTGKYPFLKKRPFIQLLLQFIKKPEVREAFTYLLNVSPTQSAEMQKAYRMMRPFRVPNYEFSSNNLSFPFVTPLNAEMYTMAQLNECLKAQPQNLFRANGATEFLEFLRQAPARCRQLKPEDVRTLVFTDDRLMSQMLGVSQILRLSHALTVAPSSESEMIETLITAEDYSYRFRTQKESTPVHHSGAAYIFKCRATESGLSRQAIRTMMIFSAVGYQVLDLQSKDVSTADLLRTEISDALSDYDLWLKGFNYPCQ